MHYDALRFSSLSLVSATELAAEHLKFARFFQHLSLPAPGRGSTGVHESGFQKWNPETLSLPSTRFDLNVVDDGLEAHCGEMEAVVRRAREGGDMRLWTPPPGTACQRKRSRCPGFFSRR
jgi:hypothetical protein